ncbi:hypothetical protein D3C77_485370 [compost metagenome]
MELFHAQSGEVDGWLIPRFEEVSHRGFLPGPDLPNAVYLLLAQFLQLVDQVLLCLFPVTSSSTLSNSLPFVDFVDLPDTAFLVEAGDRFSRHVVSPRRSLRGRLLS